MSTTVTGSGVTTPLVTADDIAVDTNTIVVDATNNRLGVNNASPAKTLDVSGDVAVDTDTFVVDATNDRVGVNVASPTTALDVSGTVNATSFTGDGSSLTGISSNSLTSPGQSFTLARTVTTGLSIGSGTGDSDLEATNIGYSATTDRYIQFYLDQVVTSGTRRSEFTIDGGWAFVATSADTSQDYDWSGNDGGPPMYATESVRTGLPATRTPVNAVDDSFMNASAKDGTDTVILNISGSHGSYTRQNTNGIAYVEAGGYLKVHLGGAGITSATLTVITMDLA